MQKTPQKAQRKAQRKAQPKNQKPNRVPTVPAPSAMVRDPRLLSRFMSVVLLNRDEGGWHFRRPQGGTWPAGTRHLTEVDLLAHLTGACWIGCRAPADGITDRLALDIDVDPEPGRTATAEQLADRDRRYRLVRHAFGHQHVPLVVRTPRGGLRVLYRIPLQPLAGLVDGLHEGLVADVLRGLEGGEVRNGSLEVFPQPRKIDRLPLGRAMPILCPETLVESSAAVIGPKRKDTFGEDRLAHGLEIVERWHAAPLVTLVPHLNSMPRVSRPRAAEVVRRATSRSAASPDIVVAPTADPKRMLDSAVALASSAAMPQRSIEIGVHDVEAPGTRRIVEWAQGLAMMVAPERFAQFGLAPGYSHEEFARVLATWLSRHHNGNSAEWREAERTGGSVDAALELFVARYLNADGRDGSNFVERLERVVAVLAPARRRVLHLDAAERRMYLAAVTGLRGASRFRAEVWVLQFGRLVKRLLRRAMRRGVPPVPIEREPGHRVVRLRIPARWLEGLDYGKGSAAHAMEGASRYCHYLKLLEDAGVVRPLGDVVRPTSARARIVDGRRVGFAQVYEIAAPNMRVTVGEVGVDPRVLRHALATSGLTRYRRPISLDQALHCLALASASRGLDPSYGRAICGWVLEVARTLSVSALGGRVGDGVLEAP